MQDHITKIENNKEDKKNENFDKEDKNNDNDDDNEKKNNNHYCIISDIYTRNI